MVLPLLLASCSDDYVGDRSDEPLPLPTIAFSPTPPVLKCTPRRQPSASPKDGDVYLDCSVPQTPSATSPTQPIVATKNRALPSSTVLKKPSPRGSGSLYIGNGNSQDAYLKLVDSSRLIAAFYVKSNSTFTLKGIPDGVYQLLFVLGDDWDAKTRTFSKNASFTKFDRDLEFVTTRETRGRRIYTRYSIFRVTLNPVLEGNAPTSAIDEGEFNQK